MTPHESLSLALDEAQSGAARAALGAQAVVLRGFARERAPVLTAAIDALAAVSPFRHMVTPGGWEMLVALTNCGPFGWVTDRSGYR
jgi:alkylated DNA repair protein (DNA oxidative demethylase)